jgi:RNA polymerase sigma factor (sigma-70 family)
MPLNDSLPPNVVSDEGVDQREVLSSLVADRVEPRGVRLRPLSADADRSARFIVLMDEELERAYRLATVILGDESDGQDAVHDAAEVAWRRFADLRDPARAGPWFRQILVNRCRDRLRSRRRRLVEVLRAPFAREEPVVADSAADVGSRDLLARALDRLSADERVVVVLRYEEDLTVPAIAEMLAIPEGTAKSRLHYALAKLRQALEAGRRP